jgi:hypothetical protein
MARNRKRSSARSRARPDLTREKLLPTPVSAVRSTSLRNHLALVALRQGEGNDELVATLLRTIYLTYYLLEENANAEAVADLLCAESALKTCIEQFAAHDDWRVPETSCASIESVLRMHDAQLMSLPVHRLDNAGRRLGRILASGAFPEIKGQARDRITQTTQT